MLFLAILICFNSCKKFLDVKPDKKQVVPVSLADCQALLNNVDILGAGYPVSAEISSDDYYLTFENWNALIAQNREPYLWQANANNLYSEWSAPYNRILVANQVLETLNNIKPVGQEQEEWNRLKGAALLLRSMCYFGLSQIFSKPYDNATAGRDLGIPIRLSASIEEKIERGTLQQTYDQILKDFKESTDLLPSEQPVASVKKTVAMPVKAAAYAALARVYLTMGDYINAYDNADASLKQYSTLMDYKNIDQTPYYPIPRFNQEVLLELGATGLVPINYGLITSELYELYSPGDLRRSLFFRKNEDGTISFKGTYIPGNVFAGLATDEVYLIRAECSARSGNTSAALDDLNTLRQNRWDDTFTRLSADNGEDALKLIVKERRRELPFRNLRWTDLRRLNNDSRFAQTLKRTLNGVEYFLPPNDLRYTLLIPREVLERVDLPQNPR